MAQQSNPDNKPKGDPPAGDKFVTMHDATEVWDDICVCEPEPRWQALAEELEEQEKARQARREATPTEG